MLHYVLRLPNQLTPGAQVQCCKRSSYPQIHSCKDLSTTWQVIYLVREVWRGVSARADWHVLPGGDMGTKRSLADLTLTRSAVI